MLFPTEELSYTRSPQATDALPNSPTPAVGRVPVGRKVECARIELLLDAARCGQSGALVVRGEEGIGKSTLLRHAAGRAGEMRVLEVRGIDSESELPFAGLSELLRPSLHLLDSLPKAQSAALRGALALGPSEASDRFAVYTALLGLLAVMSEHAPLLCLIDDAQWLDTASAEALLFTARRLEAEGVALVFAAREGDGPEFEARGLEQLHVGCLDGEAVAGLLAIHAPQAPHRRSQSAWCVKRRATRSR